MGHFATRTVYMGFLTKNPILMRFCWCKFDFRKIWTFSFPKPSWECLFDPWILFYDFVKFADFAKNHIFGHFSVILGFHDWTSKQFKNLSRRRRNILRPDLERWRSILLISKKEPFCNQNDNHQIFCQNPHMDSIIPFWFQKGIKKWEICWCNLDFRKI